MPEDQSAQNAAENEEVESQELEQEPDQDQEPDGADQLGDAGKKALDEMKSKWKSERDRARKLQEQLTAASAKPKDADDGDKPDLEAIRKQARDEAKAEALRERVLDKIEAKAAGKFRDVEDALLRLSRNTEDYIDDGKVDVSQIEDDLAELLKKRPDFGVTQGDTKRFKGTADAGPKNASKSQLSQADVERLTREGKVEEIDAARKAGRLNDLLGISA